MNIIKRESPVTFSFKDNTVKAPTTQFSDFNKAAIVASAKSGLVNAIQEMDDRAVLNKEHGDYDSGFMDHALFIAKKITDVNGSVLISRLATGKEAYKTTDIYLDSVDSKLEYRLPRFKNVKPTSAYQEGEHVFSSSVDDYKVEEVEDTLDILATDADWDNTADLSYMFTIQTFKPTNFVDFGVTINPLTFSDIDDIVSKSKYSSSQIKSKFIKIAVTSVTGSKIEEFVCSIENNIVDNKGNDYSLIDVINMNSNYIYITKKRNSLGNLSVASIPTLKVAFSNFTKFYNRFVSNIALDGTVSVKGGALEAFSDSMDIKYLGDTTFDEFKDVVEGTYLKSKYPAAHSESNLSTVIRGTLPTTKTMKLERYDGEVYVKRGVTAFTTNNATTSITLKTSDSFTLADDTVDVLIYLNDTTTITVAAADVTKVDADNVTLANITEANLNKIPSQFTMGNNNILFTSCNVDEMVKPTDVVAIATTIYDAAGNTIAVDAVAITSPVSIKLNYDITSSKLIVGSSEIYNNTEDVLVNHVEATNAITTSVEIGKDGTAYSLFTKVDIDTDFENRTIGLSVELGESTLASTGDIFTTTNTYDVEGDFSEGVINTKTIKFDTFNVGLNSIYSVNGFGEFSVSDIYMTNVNTISDASSISEYAFKQYADGNTDADVDAYYIEGLNSIYKNGTIDNSIYSHLFKSRTISLNYIIDSVVKDSVVNTAVQSSIVSTVNKRKNCFGILSSKDYTIGEERSSISSYDAAGTIDPDKLLTYTYQDNMLIEVLGEWKVERLDDNSRVSTPSLGKFIGDRLTALDVSPVLNIWGVIPGKEVTFNSNIDVKESDLDFYKKMRINTAFQVGIVGKYLWHNFTTYRADSDLNKVRNVQVLVFLMNQYYPILMKYIKKPIYTLENSVDNIQNIINELYVVLKEVRGAFALEPVLELISTADDLDRGFIKIKNKLYFSDDIEAIEVVFETNDVGELYYEIISQQ